MTATVDLTLGLRHKWDLQTVINHFERCYTFKQKDEIRNWLIAQVRAWEPEADEYNPGDFVRLNYDVEAQLLRARVLDLLRVTNSQTIRTALQAMDQYSKTSNKRRERWRKLVQKARDDAHAEIERLEQERERFRRG